MPTPNQTDYSDTFTVIDGDGELASVSTLNAAIGSITLNYKTSPTAATVSTALTALASATTAHTDNRAYAVGPGVLRVDFPDAPWASGASKVVAWLTFSGGLSSFVQAGGQLVLKLAYGVQSPDSGATAIARASDVTTITDALTSISSAVGGIVAGVWGHATRTLTAGLLTAQNVRDALKLAPTAGSPAAGSTDAVQWTTLQILEDVSPDIEAIDIATGAIVAKLPSANAKIAGEGATAKNLDQVTGGSGGASVRQDHITTATFNAETGELMILAANPASPNDYVGKSVVIGGDIVRTITEWEPPEEEGNGIFTLSAGITPVPAPGTAVVLLGDVQDGLVRYTAAKSSEVAGGGTVTPTSERPSNPSRTRKVRRSLADGLTFSDIRIDVDDEEPIWWVSFEPELQSSLGIAVTEGAIEVTLDPDSGLTVTATRVGERPSKSVMLEFSGQEVGSYEMAIAVEYEGQGVNVARGTVIVR